MGTAPQWFHVGIYIGGGKMIHVPRAGKQVELVDITDGYYKNTDHHAYRVPDTLGGERD